MRAVKNLLILLSGLTLTSCDFCQTCGKKCAEKRHEEAAKPAKSTSSTETTKSRNPKLAELPRKKVVDFGEVVKLFDNESEAVEALRHESNVVIDCYAPWCGPCTAMAPVFEKIAEDPKYNEILFIKLNIDDHKPASSAFGVQAIPFFVYFKGKGEKKTRTGAMSPAEFAQWIK